MVFCAKCGAENEDEALNCVNCGAPLQATRPRKMDWEEKLERGAEEFYPSIYFHIGPDYT